MKNKFFIKNDILKLDRKAWDALLAWPDAIGFDPFYNGIDYAAMLRWRLWHKIGRYFRFNFPEANNSLEEKLMKTANARYLDPYFATRFPKLSPEDELSLRHKRKKLHSEDKHIVFIPCPNRLGNVIDELKLRNKTCIWTAMDLGVPLSLLKEASSTWLDELYNGILDGLSKKGTGILSVDREILKREISGVSRALQVADAQMNILKPDLLLVRTDDGGRSKAYVLAAQKYGIPVFKSQEGLDCEHFWFDKSYSTYVAAWGNERIDRYRNASPEADSIDMRATGNPSFDHLRPPEKINTEGRFIIWLTRPHLPERCYLPSRTPQEGIDIFDALLDILKECDLNLCIKPHPYTFDSLFLERAEERGMKERVFVYKGNLHEILNDAKLVVSEDSTAGLEAMIFGKPLIHAHFAPSPPVMPFVSYGAAFPGWDAASLKENIFECLKLDKMEQHAMHSNQLRFIKDFASELDGHASKRAVNFIEEILYL